MAAVDSEEPQEAVAELAAQEARAAHTAEEAQAKVVEWEEVKGMEEQVEEGLVEGGLVEEEMVEAEAVEMEGEVSREAEVETQADHEGATEVEWALVGEEGAGRRPRPSASARAVARPMARARQLWRHGARQRDVCRGHWGARVGFCFACISLGGVLARAFWRMRVADTHSLASPIVSIVSFFVSFKIISVVIIMSVHRGHGGNVGVGCMHGVFARRARLARSARCRAVAMLVRVLSMPARGRPTASQWPVTRAPQKHFDVQVRVAVCEHVRWW